MTSTAARRALVLAVLLSCGAPPAAGAQESLATVRALYEDAAYRDALALADRLRLDASIPDGQLALVERYRALCLFAVNEPDAAAAALEGMVTHDPLLDPAEAELPPRVRRAMEQTRLRLLPGLARDAYTSGKRTYDERQYATALEALDRAVAITDAALALGASPESLADVRLLAVGFRDLAASAAAVSQSVGTTGTAPPAAGTAPAAAASGASGATTPAAQAPSVNPPVTVRQELPPWPASLRHLTGTRPAGLLEVTIGADGSVQSARMLRPLHPAYDHQLIAAARQWKYQPASRDGVAVSYVKLVRIDVAQP